MNRFLLLFLGLATGLSADISYLGSIVHKAGSVSGLGESPCAVESPDGKFIYTVCQQTSTVAWFSADTGSKKNEYLGFLSKGVDKITGLNGAAWIVLSPDGRFAYIAGPGDDAIAVFLRNAVTGSLTFVQTVSGLTGVSNFCITPDGRHLYVAATGSSTVAYFERDSAAGTLTYKSKYVDNSSMALNYLAGVTAVAVSPDGINVYAVSPNDSAVTSFSRNPATGALTPIQTLMNTRDTTMVRGFNSPRKIAVSQIGLVFIAGYNSIVPFVRNTGAGGTLAPGTAIVNGSQFQDGLSEVSSLCISPDNRFLYVTARAGGFFYFRIQGGLYLASSSAQSHEVHMAAGTFCLTAAKGRMFYALSQGSRLNLFTRDSTTGEVTFAYTIAEGSGGVQGLNGVFSLVESLDGKHVYTGSASDSGIALFSRSATDGTLSYQSLLLTGDRDTGISNVYATAISADGKNIYALENYMIKSLYLSPTNGSCKVVSRLKDSLNNARGVAISPDGKNVYVVSMVNNAISIFSREADSGKIAYQNCIKLKSNKSAFVSGAFAVAVSPEGTNVYVAAISDNAITIFTRDLTTGGLTVLDSIKDSINNVDGLKGVMSLAISSDGKNVYAAGTQDSALAIFSRNKTDGKLIYVKAIRNKVDTLKIAPPRGGTDSITIYQTRKDMKGLFNISEIKISPDGSKVFGVAMSSVWSETGLIEFMRDPGTGNLQFVRDYPCTDTGYSSLGGSNHILISKDGNNAYVSAWPSSSSSSGVVSSFTIVGGATRTKGTVPKTPQTNKSKDVLCLIDNTALLKYTLPEAVDVSLVLYDLQGKSLKILTNVRQLPGKYTVPMTNRMLSKGIYMLDFSAGSLKVRRRIVLY